MKKSSTFILAFLAVLAGCSSAPTVIKENGVGNESVTIAYGKVLNVKEYSQVYNDISSIHKTHEVDTNKPSLGKNYSLGRPVPADDQYDEFINTPIVPINMVELHIKNEQGPTFKIDQIKNGSYYMGQRVRITMTGNEAKITPY